MKKTQIALISIIASITCMGFSLSTLAGGPVDPQAGGAMQSFHPYVGAYGGYGFQNDDAKISTFNSDLNLSEKGWLGGGQVGLGYFASNFYLGAQFNADWKDIKGQSSSTIAIPIIGSVTVTDKTRLRYTLGLSGRLGYVFLNNQLVTYLSGGYAWTKVRDTLTAGTDSNTLNYTEKGFTFGFGANWAVNTNWMFGIDYTYFYYGAKSFPLITGITARTTPRASQTTFNVSYVF